MKIERKLNQRFVILTVLFLLAQPLWAGKRVALVVGNGDYQSGRLRNPVNDAEDIAEALRGLGYRVWEKHNLPNRRSIDDTIRAFKDQAADAEVALLYYAGHGVQLNGRNYLIPTQAVINSSTDLKYDATDLEFVLDELGQRAGGLNLVILDACRDNPYPKDSRSGADRGLARMDAPSATLIAYATAPGRVANDGDGRNSPYAKQLVAHLRTPGLTVLSFFNQVAGAVERDTKGQQSPREEKSYLPPLCFTGACGAFGDGESGKFLHLTVKTTPVEATVRILNINPKYRDGIELRPGRYHVEVTAPGFERYSEWVELANKDLVFRVALSQPVSIAAADQSPDYVKRESNRKTEVASGKSEKELYMGAYEMLRNGKYIKAIEAFNAQLASFPRGEYADNATFWLGEAYKVNRDLESAKTAFRKVIGAFPNSPKVPDALLKLGYIELSVGGVDKAQEYFRRVAADYPGTTAARLAQDKLFSLKMWK